MIHTHRFEGGAIEIQISSTSAEAFKELVFRATNLWPDAPPEVKQFADMICNDGKLMQDYRKATVTNQPTTKVCSCEFGGLNSSSAEYMEKHCKLSCPRHP